jgi:hypothetical protein
VQEAAGKAGERLKSVAEERGLTSEGLKEVAGEVANTFKDAMSGKSQEGSGASSGTSAAAGGPSQNFGVDQSKPGALTRRGPRPAGGACDERADPGKRTSGLPIAPFPSSSQSGLAPTNRCTAHARLSRPRLLALQFDFSVVGQFDWAVGAAN